MLLPGWGFDARVFDSLDLDFNYLLPRRIDPERLTTDLVTWLQQEGIKAVSLFGWSMGGFIALDFLQEYREVVQEVYLVSMRTRFAKEQIEAQRALLTEDRTLYLGQFYRNCFTGQKRAFQWFERTLLLSYIKIFDRQSLLKGLDYLGRQELKHSMLTSFPVRLIHGRKDRIAPFSEISETMAGIPCPFLVFDQSGHLPFLDPHFKERLAHGV